MPKLIIRKGKQIVKRLAVPEDILAFTIGSEEGNDIRINETSISYYHLQFEKKKDQYYVRDLQSQTGTFVNDKRISQKTLLKPNDRVRLGKHIITFVSGLNKSIPGEEKYEDLGVESDTHEPSASDEEALILDEKELSVDEIFEEKAESEESDESLEGISVTIPGFDLWIDPGNATQKEIIELLEALSDLQRAEGGFGVLVGDDRIKSQFLVGMDQ